MLKLRPYQKTIIELGKQTLLTRGFVYLAMEVRTGKTLTSLGIASEVNPKNVLFVTKKKAISSIEDDYQLLNPSFNLTTINYESIHKIPNTQWDVIICDEAHSMGAFPKPSKRAKQVKLLIQGCNPYVILLSGTPTPESFSQMYHQVYGIPNNPFSKYKNFYRFSDDYVRVVVKPIGGLQIRDYSKGHENIIHKMQPYTINFSQKNAGFKVETIEEILYVSLQESTYELANKLKKHLVVEGNTEVLMGDTPVKLMSKLHQIYSGTVKFESGNSMVLDLSKAKFIKNKFANKKIAIFYKFKEELNAIKEVYGETISTELSVFKETDKNIALQIVSGREGISLKEANALVYYNIDFSATSYWQSRDRMTTKNRLKNNVYWIFSDKGIENKIYKAVTRKKDYTLKHFKRDFLNL